MLNKFIQKKQCICQKQLFHILFLNKLSIAYIASIEQTNKKQKTNCTERRNKNNIFTKVVL